MNITNVEANAAAKVANSLSRVSSGVQTAIAAAAVSGAKAATASTSSGITSNDFMTLLVTEMKNQDPTQPTDPNAYIQQLVGVNSLQQLIAIHQDLTTTITPPAPVGGHGVDSLVASSSS